MNGAASERPVALVTGASAGIGAAIVRRLAAGGFRIVAVARRQEKLTELAKSLVGITDVETVAADVAQRDAGDRAVAVAMKRFGRLDCLVNNAGSFKFGAVDQVDDAALDESIEISLKGPFRFCRAALRVMRPGSSIISIGSVWGLRAGMAGGSYCTVKAGLIGLTQSIAADYGARGIRANLVAPGVVRTDMTDGFWETEAFKRANHEMTPFNRDCTVDDVANTVYFLASEQGSYINGQTLALDGGWSTTKFLSHDALTSQRVPA
jgi:meso-butanediol dehydrogenase/(S,S)-butanediol dehydrogenase/diacetyl reductase